MLLSLSFHSIRERCLKVTCVHFRSISIMIHDCNISKIVLFSCNRPRGRK